MTLNDVIKNLKEQARDRASMIDPDDAHGVFARDAEALREAVRILSQSQERACQGQRMTRMEILESAAACVSGGRDVEHGEPENCFPVIAQFWEAYLQECCASVDADVCIGPGDVCAMMALLKIARIASGQSNPDNWIDIAGYAACGGELDAAAMA